MSMLVPALRQFAGQHYRLPYVTQGTAAGRSGKHAAFPLGRALACRLDVRAGCAILSRMDKPSPPSLPATRGPAPPAKVARLEREAAALRENLRKRKEQARAREKPKPV